MASDPESELFFRLRPWMPRRVGEAHAPLSSPTNEPPTAWAARPPYVHPPRSERTGIAIREIPDP